MKTKNLSKTKQMLIILLFIGNIAYSQETINYSSVDSGEVYTIKLADQTKLTGKVFNKDANHVFIETEGKIQIKLPFNKIKTIKKATSFLYPKNEFEISNPVPSTYLFAPSAINLKKGELVFQNKNIFVNTLEVGITDYVSIGAGFEMTSTFLSLVDNEYFKPIYFIKPKMGFKVSENFHIATNALLFFIPMFTEEETKNKMAGVISGLGTYGTNDNNITLGVGYSFADQRHSKNPAISVSGISKLSKRTAFITENWFFSSLVGESLFNTSNPSGYNATFSYGVRLLGEKMVIDLALINNKNILKNWIIGMPNIDITFKL